MRQIIFNRSFDDAVEKVGGYRVVDQVLEAVLDGLRLNPYAFPIFEHDLVSFRYVVTQDTGETPSLLFTFLINDDKNVELTHVEIFDPY